MTRFELVNLFLTKEALYRLSYMGLSSDGADALWSGRRESNSRQPAWKAGALPIELLPRTWRIARQNCTGILIGAIARTVRQMQGPDVVILTLPVWAKSPTSGLREDDGGGGRIRTSEGFAGRFTVCSLWPLGNPTQSTIHLYLEPTEGFEPPTH